MLAQDSKEIPERFRNILNQIPYDSKWRIVGPTKQDKNVLFYEKDKKTRVQYDFTRGQMAVLVTPTDYDDVLLHMDDEQNLKGLVDLLVMSHMIYTSESIFRYSYN